ncbi:homoserine kinase [Bacillus luteolus]|uniref:Homoserine kinase n=1 Tax=Litchfieldia luteola TaxID=682179 RepID=A0ABR9QFZ0_9BACI|nr:homoserine kinase [Cytobacillus luteolus]MBE4907415.1 homoserine kinase [Cytobacillus luteolus]MBP1944181.1 homoserine kinase [Cytobacillus luteolus]
MLKITVPGSTANLGPGFDSIGLAITKYLKLNVSFNDKWCFIPQTKEVVGIPSGKENLIYIIASNIAKQFNKSLPPCSIEVWSDIPLARGLGSSAAAIAAGIELANALCGLDLTQEQKVHIGSLSEGHPDNIGASLMGGLVVGKHNEESTFVVKLGDVDVDLNVVIPPYKVMTKDARKVLPKTFTFQDAVQASSVSNVLLAALFTKNWDYVGRMMEQDMFHERYRLGLIPEIEDIRAIALEAGAFGVALSGAGPTVICFSEKGRGKDVENSLREQFPKYKVEQLSIDYIGSRVEM